MASGVIIRSTNVLFGAPMVKWRQGHHRSLSLHEPSWSLADGGLLELHSHIYNGYLVVPMYEMGPFGMYKVGNLGKCCLPERPGVYHSLLTLSYVLRMRTTVISW